jgi:hypothetical protein
VPTIFVVSRILAHQPRDCPDRSTDGVFAPFGDGAHTAAEIVKQHGGDILPLLDECDRIGALVREERAQHRAASRRMAREVAATAEKYLGKWWDDNEYGESILDEATHRFLNGGAEIDY